MNERDEVTIVTAFFDIGRESFAAYPRTKEDYFSYFKFWARIRNTIVVFCRSEDEEKIQEIRRDFGRKDKTITVPIDDIYSIEPEIFKKMQSVEQSSSFINFRYFDVACSNLACYNYVMLLKYYFLAEASKTEWGSMCNTLVWLDFGFNHGGRYYSNPEDFNFLWKWRLRKKIELFCLSNPEQMSVIDSLQFQKDCIQGTVVGCKRDHAVQFWGWMKEMMQTLLSLECMDDDQHLLLMVYKAHKEEIHMTVCNWYQPLELTTKHVFRKRVERNKILENEVQEHDLRHFEEFLQRNRERLEKYY